jgi:hypothetical protein
MKKLTIINPSSKSIVLSDLSRAKAAEWLGVTPSAINNTRSGMIQGYLLLDMSFPHWAIGYKLSAKEQDLLGLGHTYQKPVLRQCTGCGSTHGLLDKYELCTVCLGLAVNTLGTIRPSRMPIAVTDGIDQWPSIKAAALATGRKPSTAASAIYKCAIGKTKSYLGKQWTILPKGNI